MEVLEVIAFVAVVGGSTSIIKHFIKKVK